MDLHHLRRQDHRERPLWLAAGLNFLLAVAVAMMVLGPRPLMAQSAPERQTESRTQPETDAQAAARRDDGEDFFGESHRRRIYEESKLSTTTAVLYNLAVPGLGNVYAEQYLYGGIAFTLMAFTAVFIGYGLVTNQTEFLYIGAGTAGIAYTGSIATSIVGVHDYNTELRQGLKLDEAAATPFELPQAPAVNVGFAF